MSRDDPAALPDHLRLALPDQRPLLVAFSGGPDSTALLHAAVTLATREPREVLAAHLDHGLDPGSATRAQHALALATAIGIPLITSSLTAPCPRGVSREAFARHARYQFLDDIACRADAWILTAHHADDQAETVLLRLLFGSGIEGLAAIATHSGRVIRPFLQVRREVLRRYVEAAGFHPVDDPTNADLSIPRNRLRAALLPALTADEPHLVDHLTRLATTARRARGILANTLARHLDAQAEGPGRARCARQAFMALASPLQGPALALLHRLAGASFPPPAEARVELLRQLAAGGKIGCACGRRDGFDWRWVADRQWLYVESRASKPIP